MAEQTGGFKRLEISKFPGVRFPESNRCYSVVRVGIEETEPPGAAIKAVLEQILDIFNSIQMFLNRITRHGREFGINIIPYRNDPKHGVSNNSMMYGTLVGQIRVRVVPIGARRFLVNQGRMEIMVYLFQDVTDFPLVIR